MICSNCAQDIKGEVITISTDEGEFHYDRRCHDELFGEETFREGNERFKSSMKCAANMYANKFIRFITAAFPMLDGDEKPKRWTLSNFVKEDDPECCNRDADWKTPVEGAPCCDAHRVLWKIGFNYVLEPWELQLVVHLGTRTQKEMDEYQKTADPLP